jgi:hypothetical protein
MAKPNYFGVPPDPSTRTCEWCEATAVACFEIYHPRKKVGTAIYVCGCGRHEQLARESARPAPTKAAK